MRAGKRLNTENAVLVPLRDNEAGRMLGGVGRTTVWRLIQRGELVQVNIGTRSFVTAESIRAYVDRMATA